MAYAYPNSIEEAANLLDKDKPDWYTKIVRTLVMGSPDNCLLGQIYGNYYTSFEKLFGKPASYERAGDTIFGNRAFPSTWYVEIDKRKKENDFMNRRSIIWAANQIQVGHKVHRKGKDVIYSKAQILSFTLEDLESVDWQIYEKPLQIQDLKRKDKFKFKGEDRIAIKLDGPSSFLYEDEFLVKERVRNYEVVKV